MQVSTIMGQRQHRAWVGPPDYYDRLGAVQFVTLLMLGMREDDSLLDIGCGSLRGGRFSILYLNPGHYFGIEPEEWCLRQGISKEIGHDLINLKRPQFRSNSDFEARHFGRDFSYIMAAGIFMHACLRQVDSCFESVGRVLSKDGVFVGAYLTGESDSQALDWTYPDIQRYKPSTLTSVAQRHGLQISFPRVPHPLDHHWFLATRSTSSRSVELDFDMSVFSWREYLATQIRARSGNPQSYEHYLKHELRNHLDGDDRTVVPQARL